ncbi:MAG: hypothetical protein KAW87_07915 [Candidatus Cloacimonetes bacterium]|nr:hypothetical protein [Candidatus Cloacimonadota bacterium]
MLNKVKSLPDRWQAGRLFSGKKYIIITIALALVVIISGCAKVTTKEENPVLYFSSTEYNTSVGSYVQITVKIDNAENLFACSMVIQYTTSKVDYEVGSLTAGSFWPVNLVKMSKEDGVGLSVCVGLKQTAVSDGITGSGSLFSFRLEGKNTGETALTITNVYLLDEDANYIENFDELEKESSKVVVS